MFDQLFTMFPILELFSSDYPAILQAFPWFFLWFLHGQVGGFLSHRGGPTYHPFLDGIVHDKPSILGYPQLHPPSWKHPTAEVVASISMVLPTMFGSVPGVTPDDVPRAMGLKMFG